MPELPEVETVTRALRGENGASPLTGRVITAVRVLWPRELHRIPVDVFSAQVTGMRVAGIGRVGKYILIHMDGHGGGRTMLVHLRMTGALAVVPLAEAFTKHARVVWLLDGGLALRFSDPRKFGRVYLPERLEDVTGLIGPDALEISEAEFMSRVRARARAIKPLLLDQTVLAGVGNIYADESLHRARLHPLRSGDSLTPKQSRALFTAVRAILLEGIAANGASFDWVYPGGSFQDNFHVYGQTGKPCRHCGTVVQRIVVTQRATHFCPKCQPLK